MSDLKECVICNKLWYYLTKKNGYDFCKCSICWLVWVSNQPDFKKLKKIYNHPKYHKSRVISEYWPTIVPEYKWILRNLNKIISWKNVNSLSWMKILDVWCSNWEFLFRAKKEYNLKDYWLEINTNTYKTALKNKINVFNGRIEDVKFGESFFDIIRLWDVIEHVNDPIGMIKRVRKIMKKWWVIVIKTPNMNSFWVKSTYLFHKYLHLPWSSITPPGHLFQFSNNNLKKLLVNNWFEVIKYTYHSPSFKYEIWYIWVDWEEKVKITFKLLLTLSIYIVIYTLNKIKRIINKKDFEMTIYAKLINK